MKNFKKIGYIKPEMKILDLCEDVLMMSIVGDIENDQEDFF